MKGKSQSLDAGFELGTANGVVGLEAHVQHRVGGQLRHFHVLIQVEGLVPKGRARTYHAKQQAEQAVRKVTTRPIWANEIEVS